MLSITVNKMLLSKSCLSWEHTGRWSKLKWRSIKRGGEDMMLELCCLKWKKEKEIIPRF
jgi:hypothetical protein